MLKVTDIILASDTYNGHYQLELNVKLPTKDIMQLCDDLSEALNGCFVYFKLYPDGCGSIYQEDYWGEGEHPLGHRDRLLVSCIEAV